MQRADSYNFVMRDGHASRGRSESKYDGRITVPQLPRVEGWVYRFGRNALGRSFFHKRYFVLEGTVLAYHKKKPADDDVPVRTLQLTYNCRVEDRGLETHHGHSVYVLSVYNKKDRSDRISMATLTVQDSLTWKAHIEQIIDEATDNTTAFQSGAARLVASTSTRDFQMASMRETTGQKDKPNMDCLSSLSDSESVLAARAACCKRLADSELLPLDMQRDEQHGISLANEEATPQIEMQRDQPRSINIAREECHRHDLQRDLRHGLSLTGRGAPDELADWKYGHEEQHQTGSPRHAGSYGSRTHWRLTGCQNGLRVFEELQDPEQPSRMRAMKAVGVIEAACEDVFQLIIAVDETRYEWDVNYLSGRVVEEVDGHTAIIHQCITQGFMPGWVSPRDICYLRYWRRNDDGTYVILAKSTVHEKCPPEPGFVRANLESGGWIISPLKPRRGIPRSRVQHLIQIDVKMWPIGGLIGYNRFLIMQSLSSVACIREWFNLREEGSPVGHNVNASFATNSLVTPSRATGMLAESVEPHRTEEKEVKAPGKANSQSSQPSDTDDEEEGPSNGNAINGFKEEHGGDAQSQSSNSNGLPPIGGSKGRRSCSISSMSRVFHNGDMNAEEGPPPQAGPSHIEFPSSFKRGDHKNGVNCWSSCIPSSFRVRSSCYLTDRSKVPSGPHLLELVAVDWFKAKVKLDHLAQCKGSAARVAAEQGLFSVVINVQVPAADHYSMVFYFVAMQPIQPGSLLHRFINGNDRFRNSRFKLIPAVPKGPWLVRQSVGSTPCLLGKALECTYHKTDSWLEADVDIGSSTVANGVLGLVFGYVTSLAVDMAFLIQSNTNEELPEQLLGSVRVSRMRLDAAVPPPPDHESWNDPLTKKNA